MLSLDRLQALLKSFPRLTIGLVGDLFLDRYLHLVPQTHELSIETGIEAYQIDHVRNAPGALGTVLNNLAALGAGLLVPVTVIGDDGHGYDLLRAVRRLPVDVSHILCRRDRLTPTYTKPLRPLDDGTWQELNRLDVRTRAPLPADATEELCRRIREVFHTSDGLIVLDQVMEDELGVVNEAVRATLDELAAEAPDKLILVDSRARLGQFSTATLKGNAAEFQRAAATLGHAAPSELGDVALALAERNGRTVYLTQGEDGIFVAGADGTSSSVPGIHVSGPVDIVGAGDAATSGLVTALLAGASEIEAATIANLVASITVEQLGTTGTASPQQVVARWQEAYGAMI